MIITWGGKIKVIVYEIYHFLIPLCLLILLWLLRLNWR